MQALTKFAGEDAFDDALRHMYVGGAVYCRSDLRPPWAFSIGKKTIVEFHAVARGRGLLQVEGHDRQTTLSAGDLVLLPHGSAHVMRDHPTTDAAPIDEVVARHPLEEGMRLKIGNRGPLTILLCGGFEVEAGNNNPLLANLPAIIHIRGKRSRSVPWLRMTLQQLELETRSSSAGGRALVSRLSDILFIQALREYFNGLAIGDGNVGSGPWMRALKDPQVGAAIALLHQKPEYDWQVASLAAKVGMSRSSFSARFHALAGEPPLKYLAKWRALKAAWLLRTCDATLSEVASRVGYDSEIALSRAFKRFIGLAPGAYRKQKRSSAEHTLI